MVDSISTQVHYVEAIYFVDTLLVRQYVTNLLPSWFFHCNLTRVLRIRSELSNPQCVFLQILNQPSIHIVIVTTNQVPE